ncbi:MAG: nucleotidyltransferase domain-containing protein [bacterium]
MNSEKGVAVEASLKKIWSEKEERVINELVQKVRDTFKERVKRIVLYGSRARDDADEESDYDFIVLLEPFYEEDKRTLSDIGWEVSYDHNVLLLAIAIENSEFTEDRFFYFYENVCKEGIDL